MTDEITQTGETSTSSDAPKIDTPVAETSAPAAEAPKPETPSAEVIEATQNAHDRATDFINTQRGQSNANKTHNEMRQTAEQAAQIAKDLHQTIEQATPAGDEADVMRADGKQAHTAIASLTPEQDPLKTYEGYSAYAIPQDNTIDANRNYHDAPLTYDNYQVKEGNNNLQVNLSTTELIPGQEASATRNPHAVTGSSYTSRSFSYNETTSNGKTTVVTEQTLHGTHAPSSEHIHLNQDFIDEFDNKQISTLVYDKNDRLVEQTFQNRSDRVISDSKAVAYKKQDMSSESDKGYFHTSTEVRTSQGSNTTFHKVELNKDKKVKKEITGYYSKRGETYTSQTGENYLFVAYKPNSQGQWTYTGTRGKIKDDVETQSSELSPELAEKEFNRLKKTVTHEVKDLTGVENGLEGYGAQLGGKKQTLSLDAYFNSFSTPKDKEEALKANEQINKKFSNTPAAVVTIKER